MGPIDRNSYNCRIAYKGSQSNRRIVIQTERPVSYIRSSIAGSNIGCAQQPSTLARRRRPSYDVPAAGTTFTRCIAIRRNRANCACGDHHHAHLAGRSSRDSGTRARNHAHTASSLGLELVDLLGRDDAGEQCRCRHCPGIPLRVVPLSGLFLMRKPQHNMLVHSKDCEPT